MVFAPYFVRSIAIFLSIFFISLLCHDFAGVGYSVQRKSMSLQIANKSSDCRFIFLLRQVSSLSQSLSFTFFTGVFQSGLPHSNSQNDQSDRRDEQKPNLDLCILNRTYEIIIKFKSVPIEWRKRAKYKHGANSEKSIESITTCLVFVVTVCTR